VALVEHQAGCFLFEFGGKRTSLSSHRTPLNGEHCRLSGCPVSLDHYRTTLLPAPLIIPIKHRIAQIEAAWRSQEEMYKVPVSLPFALRRKYPRASVSLAWQWL